MLIRIVLWKNDLKSVGSRNKQTFFVSHWLMLKEFEFDRGHECKESVVCRDEFFFCSHFRRSHFYSLFFHPRHLSEYELGEFA